MRTWITADAVSEQLGINYGQALEFMERKSLNLTETRDGERCISQEALDAWLEAHGFAYGGRWAGTDVIEEEEFDD